jgi:hypothetical protein
MKYICNRSFAILLVILLSFSTLTILNVKAQEEDAVKELVLNFLGEVVQIDMSQYDASFSSFDTTNWIANLTTITGQYTLLSTGFESSGASLITGIFTIVDNKLIGCTTNYSQNPPIFIEQPEDSVEKAIALLQRYHTFTNDQEVLEMKDILETVNPKTNTTIIIDNIKLEVEYELMGVNFCWSRHFNGADFSRLILNFEDGQFDSFWDSRSYRKIGSTQVNISEEQAKAFALDQVKAYSFECENGTVIELDFIEEAIKAELKVGPRYSQGEYYPLWMVNVPLDWWYGHISYFTVIFWADNGEVEDVIPLGGGVGLLVDPEQIHKGSLIKTSNPPPYLNPIPTQSPTPMPTSSPTSDNQQTLTTETIIGIAIIVAVLGASTSFLIYLMKKK